MLESPSETLGWSELSMPRKVNYGAHYDEDYDDWDGYDHESDIEEDGHVIKADHAISKTKHAVTKAGLWRCPMCTFDNESCEVACEICGVFRYPAVDICSKDDEDTGKLEKLTSSTVSLNIAAKKGKSKMLSNTKDARTSFHLQEVGQPRVKESNNSLVMGQSQTSRSHFKKINVDEDFESLKRHVNSRKSKLSPQRLRETWTPPDEVGALTQLNLAIVRLSLAMLIREINVVGRLLSLLGQISQKDMHKYEKEAKLIIFAILVIDASVGSFEAGMDVNGGQTREHAQLIRSPQCIPSSSWQIWLAVKWKLKVQNLFSSKELYHGPHLLAMIDSLESPPRDTSKPLLMPICDVIKSHSLGQVAASGKLEYGTIQCGLKVLIMPSKELAVIRSIERGSKACNVATAGDSVAVGLQGIDSTHVMAGGVLCHQDFPVMVANHLELKVIMLDGAMPIVIGSQVEFHVHHAKEAAKVAKILCLFDLKTGQVSKRGPRCLTAKQNALVEVILDKGVCVEEFSNCRVLGRVFLRALGRTIAVGIVTRIIG
ncbi:hypothetical protein Scep_022640 [Stephania cephalantha]|uniref:RanBP2-type domain-containing protein n=1 Tax=Stephania cephalantha TaxID=152367 RepID=A0AAP0I2B7_9MAGN